MGRAIAALSSALTLALALGLGGCSTVEYVAQAACGQIDLGTRTRPLGRVVVDKNEPGAVRELLADMPAIKRFAVSRGLKATTNYESYADVHRAAVVYVVSASDPLAFKPVTWSFPVVGSVPYLGWFDKDDARLFADELRARGWDVDLRGADAYSTLGWFRDPILSTMLSGGEDAEGLLANVVLHESVHATYYVKGQAALNESVADFLGDKLARKYLKSLGTRGVEVLAAYDDGMREREVRGDALHAAHAELEALYRSNATREAKLAHKRELLARLRQATKFRRPITNATLNGFAVYHSGRAELEALYASCGDDASRMLASLRTLPKSVFKKPHDDNLAPILRSLVAQRCAASPTAGPDEATGAVGKRTAHR